MELEKRLVELRKEKNLSQEELAEKLYVSRQTISCVVADWTFLCPFGHSENSNHPCGGASTKSEISDLPPGNVEKPIRTSIHSCW